MICSAGVIPLFIYDNVMYEALILYITEVFFGR